MLPHDTKVEPRSRTEREALIESILACNRYSPLLFTREWLERQETGDLQQLLNILRPFRNGLFI